MIFSIPAVPEAVGRLYVEIRGKWACWKKWVNCPEGTGSKYMVREVARDAKWSENDRKSGCAERKDLHFHYIGLANGGLCEKLGFTDFGGSVGTETAFSSWRDGPWAPEAAGRRPTYGRPELKSTTKLSTALS